MRILVTAATRHGSTAEIAEAIAKALRAAGADVVVSKPDAVDELDGLDAVILGSGIYAGSWLEPAVQLATRRAETLGALPVWLFSSGPVGAPPRPAAELCVKLDERVIALGAREHHVFAGRLDHSGLGFIERALVLAFHAAEGDFRDWDEVAAWAAGIAAALERPKPALAPA